MLDSSVKIVSSEDNQDGSLRRVTIHTHDGIELVFERVNGRISRTTITRLVPGQPKEPDTVALCNALIKAIEIFKSSKNTTSPRKAWKTGGMDRAVKVFQ